MSITFWIVLVIVIIGFPILGVAYMLVKRRKSEKRSPDEIYPLW